MSGVQVADRRTAWVAPAVSLGLVLLLWAATAGPVAVLSPSGRRREITPRADATASASAEPQRDLEQLKRTVQQTHDLRWLGTLFAWAVVIGCLLALLLLVRWAWRNRWRRPEQPPEVDFDVLPASQVAQVLAADVDVHLDAMAAGSPRNGIVRCWLALEESVAEAGVPPLRSETSAEFTVRVLHALDLDPRAIGELADLYREARFSEHELGEEARTAARSALERLHEELRQVGAVR